MRTQKNVWKNLSGYKCIIIRAMASNLVIMLRNKNGAQLFLAAFRHLWTLNLQITAKIKQKLSGVEF